MAIVKVQIPLFTTSRSEKALVYDKDRKHEKLVSSDDLPSWLLDELEKHPKVFAHAEWERATGWEFIHIAEWQSW